MYRPKHTPLSNNESIQPLPESFSLLCWNLQKVDFSGAQQQTVEQLLNIEEMHLLSLQEARINAHQNRFFGRPFSMAPNIETPKSTYGVITASDFQQTIYQQFLTTSRELGFTTHKPAVITNHPLSDGSVLTHVNIHAINFVPHYVFKKELQLLWNKIENIEGPLIISGDFNTWNKTRVKTLRTATDRLHLNKVDYPDIRPIKTLNRQPLDHIFYRNLRLQSSRVINVPHISDHNPIIAKFSI